MDAIDWREKCNDCLLSSRLVRDQAEGEKSVLCHQKFWFPFLHQRVMPATNFMLSINLSSDDAVDRRRGRIPPAERVFWRRPHFVFFGASLIPRSLSRVESGWWRSHVRPDQSSSQALWVNINFMQCLCCFSVDRQSRDRGIHDRARLINSVMTALAEGSLNIVQ